MFNAIDSQIPAAARQGHEQRVLALLGQVPVDEQVLARGCAIVGAAWGGHTDLLRALLYGRDGFAVIPADEQPWARRWAIDGAAQGGQIDLLQALLDDDDGFAAIPDAEQPDARGWAIQGAALCGHIALLRALLYGRDYGFAAITSAAELGQARAWAIDGVARGGHIALLRALLYGRDGFAVIPAAQQPRARLLAIQVAGRGGHLHTLAHQAAWMVLLCGTYLSAKQASTAMAQWEHMVLTDAMKPVAAAIVELKVQLEGFKGTAASAEGGPDKKRAQNDADRVRWLLLMILRVVVMLERYQAQALPPAGAESALPIPLPCPAGWSPRQEFAPHIQSALYQQFITIELCMHHIMNEERELVLPQEIILLIFEFLTALSPKLSSALGRPYGSSQQRLKYLLWYGKNCPSPSAPAIATSRPNCCSVM